MHYNVSLTPAFQDIIEKLYNNPKQIFNLPDQDSTYIEVDLDEEWTIPTDTRYCRSKWTPFAGRRVRGCVRKVVLRGEVAYIDGKVRCCTGKLLFQVEHVVISGGTLCNSTGYINI